MDILDNSEIGSEGNSTLTSIMKTHLAETAKWGKFLAIVGFVGIGLMVIAAFSISAVFSKLGNMPGMESFGSINPGFAFTFIYLVFAVLWFFPVFYLFKFSTGIQKSIPTMNITGIEEAFGSLKSLFKYYGIFTVVILSFYGIIFLFAIIGGLASL